MVRITFCLHFDIQFKTIRNNQFCFYLGNEYESVEYLEPEYINTFVNCLEQSEEARHIEQIDEASELEVEIETEEIEADEIDEEGEEEEEDENENELESLNEDESIAGSEERTESDGGQGETKEKQKRKYPHKCKNCSKRFVYKEVFDAHIRMHKGLPGFQ